MDQNRLVEILDRQPTGDQEDSRSFAEEIRDRLLSLSARELHWILELLSFLQEEAWHSEREEIANTVADILIPEKAKKY